MEVNVQESKVYNSLKQSKMHYLEWYLGLINKSCVYCPSPPPLKRLGEIGRFFIMLLLFYS